MGAVRLFEDFISLKMKRCQSYKDFILKLLDSLSKLKEAGQTITPDQMKLKLVNNAPSTVKILLQFHMSQGRTYEQLRREALAWSLPLVNEEISANTTSMNVGRRGGYTVRNGGNQSGGKSQTKSQSSKQFHKNKVYKQGNKFKSD